MSLSVVSISENYLCKTNTSSNTALRGFGASASALIMENIIDNISRKLGKDSTIIRRRNFYLKDKKNITHYGQKIHDNVTISGPTGGQLGDDNPVKGPLMLQGDHGPVSFRNIRIREH